VAFRPLHLLYHQSSHATLIVKRLSMTSQAQPYGSAAVRVLMAMIFILSGLSKIAAADTMRGYMEAMGVPGILLWPAILFEIGAGLLIIVGYKTRIVAALLAGFSVLTAAIFHKRRQKVALGQL